MSFDHTTAMMLTGFSPCPNDTFMFHALAHGIVECRGIYFEPLIEDVESLNLRAITMMGELSVTKLSAAALGRCASRYRVLDAGAALGRGNGPLVLRRAEDTARAELGSLRGARIAIPGENTTAHLLLRLFGPSEIEVEVMPFDRVMGAIAEGRVDAGVVIHEGRFTYRDAGLACIADLGQVWEAETALPLPLGMICTHRAVDEGVSRNISDALAASIDAAYADPARAWPWIREHSQELSEEVCRKHIALYVNEHSRSLGDEGRAAIETLFAKARAVGFFPDDAQPW